MLNIQTKRKVYSFTLLTKKRAYFFERHKIYCLQQQHQFTYYCYVTLWRIHSCFSNFFNQNIWVYFCIIYYFVELNRFKNKKRDEHRNKKYFWRHFYIHSSIYLAKLNVLWINSLNLLWGFPKGALNQALTWMQR